MQCYMSIISFKKWEKNKLQEDKNKKKDSLCSWTGRIAKMSTLPKALNIQSNAYQNSSGIFYKNS